MAGAQPVDVTILICTRNRHRLLGDTLDGVAHIAIPGAWRCEVLVAHQRRGDAVSLPPRCREPASVVRPSALIGTADCDAHVDLARTRLDGH